jgi:phospholipase/lecithinase/hemolysin
LKKLVLLQRVQGQVRYTEYCNCTYDPPYFEVNLGATNDTLSLEDILIFCGHYQRSKGELHLITNNCFSFALELCRLLSPTIER